MFVIRPIEEKDLNSLLELLKYSGHGLTSLPRDPEVLKQRIRVSVQSFANDYGQAPGGELYLFVMEDIFNDLIIGVSGIISKIGGFEPFYFYRVEEQEYSSSMLDKKNTIKTLHFHKTHSGPAEICSLFLNPQYRNKQTGRFLSLSRFLFIAEHLEQFEREIIAEMRGVVDESGHSPFWEAAGKKFFDIPFPEADFLLMKNKAFIEELLPKHPIIVSLLPDEAQEVIAEVHPNTRPARRILETEGFEKSDLVGIFEPGPVLMAKTATIRSVKESRVKPLKEIRPKIEGDLHIVCKSEVSKTQFKTFLAHIDEQDDHIILDELTAVTLKLKIGDPIRFSILRRPK
jgi:arginine N-succinyltransferase